MFWWDIKKHQAQMLTFPLLVISVQLSLCYMSYFIKRRM